MYPQRDETRRLHSQSWVNPSYRLAATMGNEVFFVDPKVQGILFHALTCDTISPVSMNAEQTERQPCHRFRKTA